jgi:hypothetical protein
MRTPIWRPVTVIAVVAAMLGGNLPARAEGPSRDDSLGAVASRARDLAAVPWAEDSGIDEFDVVVDGTQGRTAANVVINRAAAPTNYAFRFDLPEEVELIRSENGRIFVGRVSDGIAIEIAVLDPAWAVDTTGRRVATHYEIIGKTRWFNRSITKERPTQSTPSTTTSVSKLACSTPVICPCRGNDTTAERKADGSSTRHRYWVDRRHAGSGATSPGVIFRSSHQTVLSTYGVVYSRTARMGSSPISTHADWVVMISPYLPDIVRCRHLCGEGELL